MRKILLLLVCMAGPAHAWEFSPTPICTLSHSTDDVEAWVTFDPTAPIYEIALTLKSGQWPDSATFGITFQGNRSLRIGTDRQTLSADGRTLSVRDRGFGNVLNGLEFNDRAIARAGTKQVMIPLTDAAPAVQLFRACPAPGLS